MTGHTEDVDYSMKNYSGGGFSALKNDGKIVCLYLSRLDCGVCTVIKPKVEHLLTRYPEARSWYISLDDFPEAAGEFSVFTVPAVLIFVEGRETVRYARYFSIDELDASLQRYYGLLELEN